MKKTGMPYRRAKETLTLALDESGVGAIVFALIFAVLCGFVALAVDMGHIVTAKSELQRTADAAALAGVMGLVPYINPGLSTQTPDWVQGQTKAHAIISNAANQADNQTFTLTDGAVAYGYWSLKPPAGYVQLPLPLVPAPAANLPEPAVNVTLNRNVTLYFAPLVGVSSPQTVSATATAILPAAYQTTGVPPVAVSEDTVYNTVGGTLTIDVVQQDIKPQSNKGIAGWFNLDGGSSVPSVRISAPLTSSTTPIYMVPGTKASLTDFITQGQTVGVAVIPNDFPTSGQTEIIGWAAFYVDSVNANSMTGHFVEQYFDPNVVPTAGSGIISAVAGTPKLVSP